MNRLTYTCLGVMIACLVFIAWSASLGYVYLSGHEPEGYIQYYWEYVLASLIICVLLFVIIWPLNTPKYYRWLISFFLLVVAAIYLLLSVPLHSPPVHFRLLCILIATALVSLFMSGYSIGCSRKNA